MLKGALYVALLKSCGPPNDIVSFFGPRLKKFADPCPPIHPQGHHVEAMEAGRRPPIS